MRLAYPAGPNDLDAQLVAAAADGDHKKVAELIAAGADINAQKYWKNTPLHAAIGEGNPKVVELLLEAGAAIELLNEDKLTPLLLACLMGGATGSKIVDLLLQQAADSHYVRASDQMTALKFAVGNCNAQTVRLLCERSSNVDGPEGAEQTAFMLAARRNDVEALQILLEFGADPHYPCQLPWAKGQNALWLAREEGSKKAVKFLKDQKIYDS